MSNMRTNIRHIVRGGLYLAEGYECGCLPWASTECRGRPEGDENQSSVSWRGLVERYQG